MRILFIAVLLVGCGTQTANMKNVRSGMTVAEVIEVMGQPKATFVSPDNKNVVFGWCDTDYIGFSGDAMNYAWIDSERVRQTIIDTNRLTGQCYEFFREPNWEATLSSGHLLLNAITKAQSEAAATNSAAAANAFIQGMQSGQQSKPTFTNCWTDISGMQYCSSY
jgi:hypothetical protein